MTSPAQSVAPRLFRVALHVRGIDTAVPAYERLICAEPIRVGDGRYYFHCRDAILACVDPAVEGHGVEHPNSGHVYFAVADLQETLARAREVGCRIVAEPEVRPWGEHSFYADDPFGNPLCFVEEPTVHTGLTARRG